MSQDGDLARALATHRGLFRKRDAKPIGERVAAVRRFNRFYTRRLGILNDDILGSKHSLPEMRVLWELAHNEGISASWLEHELGMDPGYLSRILRKFKEQGYLAARPAAHDSRIRELRSPSVGARRLR